MRITIEIEPEEAARFVKSFGVSPASLVQNITDSTPWGMWNEAASKWLDAVKDKNGANE